MPCAHEACTCITSDEFCSVECRSAVADGPPGPAETGSAPLTECACGHPDCAGTRQAARDA